MSANLARKVDDAPPPPIAAVAAGSADRGRWTALVLAGQRPGVDPVAARFGQQAKALVRVAGEAMLSRVTWSLLATPMIGRVVILAQDTKSLLADPQISWMTRDPRIAFETSSASIALSVMAETRKASWPVLVTTADHPLLSPATIEAFLRGSQGCDVAAGLVDRDVVLAAYPQSCRTWLRFRGGAYTGANLFALAGPDADPLMEFWASVEQDRKKVWRIAARLGPWILLRLLTRTITLDAAVGRLGARFGARARPVILLEPEAGIDVDKPADHALAELIFANRARVSA